MKKLSIFLFLVLLEACGKSDPAPTPSSCIHIGVTCKDGTTTTSTGSGACSSHGGVSSWKCQ